MNYILQITSASGGAVVSPDPGAAQSSVLYVASDYPHGLFEFTLPDTVFVSEDLSAVGHPMFLLCLLLFCFLVCLGFFSLVLTALLAEWLRHLPQE